MDEAERVQWAIRLREEAEKWTREENEPLAREAAIDNCDKCLWARQEQDRELSLPNGIRLSLSSYHCQTPGPECTAVIHAHLPSEPPEMANRIVKWLAAQPDLEAIGVSWEACLHMDADRLILTFRQPMLEQVAAVLGSLSIAKFRGDDAQVTREIRNDD